MKNSEQIVIVGYGWVGQANALALVSLGYSVAYFDPFDSDHHYLAFSQLYSKVTRLKNVREVDADTTIYLICVGDRVDESGVQDISSIEAALASVRDVKGTVVLRSTIVPDKLETLVFDYYVPEFLHEKTAVEECIAPHFVVVGSLATKKEEPSFFEVWRKSTPRHFEGTPREAALIKYLSNLWNATRIAFVNEFGDTIATPRSKEAVDEIHRVVDFVLEGEVYQRYGRSFGGHCLPKDTRSFAHWYSDKGSSTHFLQGVLASNAAHHKLERQHTDIPEWFSPWPTPHLSGFVAFRELLYSIKKNLRSPLTLINRYQTKLLWTAILIILVSVVLYTLFS